MREASVSVERRSGRPVLGKPVHTCARPRVRPGDRPRRQARGQASGPLAEQRSNTSKKRQRSLYNQGLHWYIAIPNTREQRLRLLIDAYGQVLRDPALTRELLGVL